MDRVEATPTAETSPMRSSSLPWALAAQQMLEELVSVQPVLIQISTAKRLRDRAERLAREAGDDQVTVELVQRAQEALGPHPSGALA